MQLVTHRQPGLVLTDHVFGVPLDHAKPDDEQIELFAREVVAADKRNDELPWLVFFQGGPGFEAQRPDNPGGWLKRALREYRVLLLDQRGTGRSTPATAQTLARLPNAQAIADYLRHFRADSIVKDAELIRQELAGRRERWSALGQSYGGFCITHYLSVAPDGLKEVVITGGLPPLERTAEEVYRATYRRVIEKNRRFYERYPDDVERAQAIVQYLAEHEVELPGGGRLSPRRFQQLGMGFGASDGFEQLHYLLEQAFVQGASGRELSYTFLHGLEGSQPFETNPIYAILHEAIYCQGVASHWAAERVRAEYPGFALAPDKRVFFTGEMIYPWMFEEYPRLRPLREAAEILASVEDWPPLYSPAALRANSIPCAATIYYNDMYVERVFAEETAATIRGIHVWVTNEYEHNALRVDGERVLDRLLGMLRGEV
jgi:pimeloyl-ACP methyl ester carboxylesterase